MCPGVVCKVLLHRQIVNCLLWVDRFVVLGLRVHSGIHTELCNQMNLERKDIHGAQSDVVLLLAVPPCVFFSFKLIIGRGCVSVDAGHCSESLLSLLDCEEVELTTFCLCLVTFFCMGLCV